MVMWDSSSRLAVSAMLCHCCVFRDALLLILVVTSGLSSCCVPVSLKQSVGLTKHFHPFFVEMVEWDDISRLNIQTSQSAMLNHLFSPF